MTYTHPELITPDLQMLTDAFRRWGQEHRPVEISLESRIEAWTLMGLLQLVVRHPELGPESRGLAERLGRLIQERICDTAALEVLAERGWTGE